MEKTKYTYWHFNNETWEFIGRNENSRNILTVNSFIENWDTSNVYALMLETKEMTKRSLDEVLNDESFLYWTVKDSEFIPYNNTDCKRITHFLEKKIKKVFKM